LTVKGFGNEVTVVVPPPPYGPVPWVPGLVTVTCAIPAFVITEAGIIAVAVLAFDVPPTVVVIFDAVPFMVMVINALLLKLVPFTTNGKVAVPWFTLSGFKALMTGVVPGVAGVMECE